MIDFQSAVWHELRQHAEEQLALARLKNDDLNLSPEETAALRGEIRVWKDVLALPTLYRARQASLPEDFA